jgi:hypothetical protein
MKASADLAKKAASSFRTYLPTSRRVAVAVGSRSRLILKKETLRLKQGGHCFSLSLCKTMQSSGILRCVALVRTDVSEEPSASIISMTRIGELGTTLAVTSNRRKLRPTLFLLRRFLSP